MLGTLFAVEAPGAFGAKRCQCGLLSEGLPPLLCCLDASGSEGLVAPELVEGVLAEPRQARGRVAVGQVIGVEEDASGWEKPCEVAIEPAQGIGR